MQEEVTATDKQAASRDAALSAAISDIMDPTGEDRYAHFRAISPEKQERIIAAALEEFASHDYASASTNTIVKRANISKGLLFHYFGDKEGLYLYLLDHVVEKYYASVMDTIEQGGGDIFAIMQKTLEAKLEVTTQHVLEARLYLRAMADRLPPRAAEFLGQTVGQAYEVFARMTTQLDGDRLREGLDREKVVQTINWAAEGLTNHLLASTGLQAGPEEFARIMEYSAEYFDFLRSLFYK
jgi:AcrR family transcriptional regulator